MTRRRSIATRYAVARRLELLVDKLSYGCVPVLKPDFLQVELTGEHLSLEDIDILHGRSAINVNAPSSEVDILRRIDLGDYVAENELNMLADYFVETHQYNVVLKPGFHLVVGRKGTGKTAISYRVASQLKHDGNAAMCEIRPNEYELMSLHEFVTNELRGARKSYVLESLWKYMIYSEVVKTAAADIGQEPLFANRTPAAQQLFEFVDSQAKFFSNRSGPPDIRGLNAYNSIVSLWTAQNSQKALYYDYLQNVLRDSYLTQTAPAQIRL